MEECIHGLEPEWCSNCTDSARAAVRRTEPKVVVKERKSKPKPSVFDLDPFLQAVERYASGAWCVKCNTPVWRGMCQCQREQRFELETDVVHEWSSQLLEIDPVRNRNAKFYAIGAVSRCITRAGIGDQMESDLLPGVTRRQAEMAMVRAELDEPAGWQVSRNSVQDPLPLPQ